MGLRLREQMAAGGRSVNGAETPCPGQLSGQLSGQLFAPARNGGAKKK
jgi:hypothetical protein